MNILFSIYVNKYNNLNELRNDIVFKSEELAAQAVNKIKNGFASLLKSISNSFASLKKIFSLSTVIENIKSNKQNPEHNMRSVFFVDIGDKINMDTDSFEYTSSCNRDELKSRLINELKSKIDERNLNNNTH